MNVQKLGLIAGMCFVMHWLHAGSADNSEPIGPPTTPPTPDAHLDEIIKEKPPSEPQPFWASQWAGVYADVNHSTTVEQLEVTATSVVYSSQGCFHNFTERSRILGATAGALCLVDDKPHDNDGVGFERFLGGELVFFRWDGAQFCAPRSALIRWIHARNFRTTSWYEPTLLKRMDKDDWSVVWKSKTIPDLPKNLARFLRAAPLSISVTEMEPMADFKEQPGQCDRNEFQWKMQFVVNDGQMPVVGSGFTLPMTGDAYEPEIGLVEIKSVQGAEIAACVRTSKKPHTLQIAAGTRLNIPGFEKTSSFSQPRESEEPTLEKR